MKTVSEGGSFIRKDGNLERVAHTAPAPGRDDVVTDDKDADGTAATKATAKVKSTRKANKDG